MCNTTNRGFLRIAGCMVLLEAAAFIAFNAILFHQEPKTLSVESETKSENETTGTTSLTTTTDATTSTLGSSVDPRQNSPSDGFLNFFNQVNQYSLQYIKEKEALTICYTFNMASNSLWFVLSLALLILSARKNLYNRSYLFLLPWIVVTAIICMTDVAEIAYFMAKFVINYKEINVKDTGVIVKSVFLPLFFARGVVIWALNVILMVLMIKAYLFYRAANKRSEELEDYELKESVDSDGHNYQSLDKLKKEDYPPSINEYDNYAFDEDLPTAPSNRPWENHPETNKQKQPMRPPSLNTAHYANHRNERRQQVPPRDSRYYDSNFSLSTKNLENDQQHMKKDAYPVINQHKHRDSIELVSPHLKPTGGSSVPNGKRVSTYPESKPENSTPDENKQKKKKGKMIPSEDPLLLPHIKPTTIPLDKYSIPRAALKK